jgi:peptidoglycan glycosyltransferase
MNFRKRLLQLGNAMLVLLLLVSTRIVYWQLVKGKDLQPLALDPLAAAVQAADLSGSNDQGSSKMLPGDRTLQGLPQPVIQRTTRLLRSITRGTVFDRDGRPLALDETDEQGVRTRVYNEPSLAPVIGYVSGLRTGVAGLEYTYNDTLLGLDRLDAQLGRVIDQPIVGSDLVLTIDSIVQSEAERDLGIQAGAVVVLDGHSGAVLAMASTPHVDPNKMLDPEYAAGLLAACSQPDCKSPFINRATQGLYVPGSTWKTVSLIAGLDTGQVKPDTMFDFGTPEQGPNGPIYYYRVGGGEIPDPNHKESKLDLTGSYAASANAAFAKIGDQMPADVFIDYARRLGFSSDDPFPLGIEYSPSILANNVDDIRTNSLLRAATAIGQGELLATPLNMAMVVLPALNKGNMPMPYFVEAVRTPSGSLIKGPLIGGSPRQVMKAKTATQVHDIMVKAVTSGSGGTAGISGYTVGGKTGTAQVGGDANPHAWFIGFVEKGDQAIVIAVMIENGGSGYKVAAPIFSKVGKVAMDRLAQEKPDALPTLPPPPTPQVQGLAGQAEQPAAPTPTTTPTARPTKTAQPGVLVQPPPAPTNTPTATPSGNLIPDIPFGPGSPSFDEDFATCPGNFKPVEGTGKFTWPSQYQAISGTNFKAGHPGIDLSAPPGTPVYASDRGRVVFAGWTDAGYGNAILIDHGDGYRTLYGHLSQVSTFCGAKVEKGQVIGLSGSTGNSSGPHLHFEVRVPGGYLDPLKVLPTP